MASVEGGVLAWDTVDSPALASREDDCRGSVRSWDFFWVEVSTKFREFSKYLEPSVNPTELGFNRSFQQAEGSNIFFSDPNIVTKSRNFVDSSTLWCPLLQLQLS